MSSPIISTGYSQLLTTHSEHMFMNLDWFLTFSNQKINKYSCPGHPLTPGKDPVPIVQETGWAPGTVWTGAKNLAYRNYDKPNYFYRTFPVAHYTF